MTNGNAPAMPVVVTKDPLVFEQQKSINPLASALTEYEGLTKREHFAGLAMQAITTGALSNNQTIEYEDVARGALLIADALLKELGE